MRKWAILGLGMALAAGAAYAARYNGVDLVQASRVTGLVALWQGAPSETPKPAQQGQAQRQNTRAQPVETGVATVMSLSDDVTAIGSLLASESVEIASDTSGRVAEVLAEDGQAVSAGTPLFRFDSDLSRAELAQSEARLALAEANYQRSQTLRKSGTVAQSAYDAALSILEVAKSETGLARVRLGKLTITAPFSGTLGFRTISPGAYVSAGDPLVQLDKTDPLFAEFSVPELDVERVAPGQAVDVVADALPGLSFQARITAINPSVSINGRALRIRASLDNGEGALRPGLLVRIAVRGSPRQAVMVPETAVVRKGDSNFVYVAEDGKARELRVRTGRRLPGKIEIVEGIAAGAEVIVAGNTRIGDGAAIEIVGHTASAE